MKPIYAILLIFIAFNSCKKKCYDASNIDCENYDPCLGKKTINTFFKVRPGNNGFPPPPDWCDLVPTDTFNASSVLFEVPEGNLDNSTYEWRIGSEAEIRTGKRFEVDFSQYLNAGKWETNIPISLTIRTPMNNCLQSKDEMVKMVTRELFFTHKSLQVMKPGENQVAYKGYFTNNASKEIVLKFIQMDTGSFRGVNAPVFLTVGMPFVDTLMAPKNCARDFCANYKHTKRKILYPEQCDTKLTYYLSSEDWILLQEVQRIKRIWEFSPQSGTERYEFIGERL